MKYFENQILCGDCIEILGRADEPFADLVFAAPPFNIGYKYDKYRDDRRSSEYIEWTRQWMQTCYKILKPAGSFWIAIGDEYAANVKVIADQLGLFMRNWNIWHYTFGQQTKNKFARAHTHLFYFVKDEKNFTFNQHAVRIPSDRQLIYLDSRANSTGKMPDDVWNTFSRVCGTFSERELWHPCQMPEILLARIICTSSNPGDFVLDPFIGSGTTAVVAAKYERKYCGIDISDEYAKNVRERISEMLGRKSSHIAFNNIELAEIERLFVEIGLSCEEYLSNNRLLNIFIKQFEHRMKDEKKYDPAIVASVLSGFKHYVFGKKAR